MINQRKIRLFFYPLIVFPYDCNVLRSWLWVDTWVRLCLDLFGMQPLLQQPRPHSQSGLTFEALQISEHSLHWPSGFLQSWCGKYPGTFLDSVYAPNGISSFDKISCYVTPKLPIIGKLMHFGVSECCSFTCFHHSSSSTFIPLLLFDSLSMCISKHEGLNTWHKHITYFRSRAWSKQGAASPEVN